MHPRGWEQRLWARHTFQKPRRRTRLAHRLELYFIDELEILEITCGSKVTYSFEHVLKIAGTIGVGLSVDSPSLHINTHKHWNGKPYHEEHKEETVTYVTS